jgi:CubicO group peptidase (beta-lactamase class C family)
MNVRIKNLRQVFVMFVLAVLSNTASGGDNAQKHNIETLFSHHLDNIQSPGFAVAIVKDGKVVFKKGYGVVDANSSESFSADTIIGIGSVAKSFTAMMILQLQEKNLLDIDDAIIKYLPWFRAADKSKSDQITIRMFLNMTSGLEQRFSQLTLNQSKQADALEKGVMNISSYHIKGEPGQSFQYINEGWNTLGLIIEKISGKPWEQVLAENVLLPLGMDNTSSDRKLLESWHVSNGHYSGIKPIPADFIHIQNSLPAGSGFYSNASDLVNYMNALLNEGKYKETSVLNEDSIDQLWTPAVSMSLLPYELGGSSQLASYAMGWMRLEIDGLDYVFHGGEFRVSSSLLVFDPENNSGVAIVYNTGNLAPYSNESSIYVANNALRILRDMPKSTFGVPRQDDPTLNDYVDTLTDQQIQKYLGKYVSKSGKRIDLQEAESQGLQLNLQESIYPANFKIDFVNQTNFIARSIAHSHKGHFIESPDQGVTAIKFLGETYRQKRFNLHGFKQYEFNKQGMKFKLPESWMVQVKPNGFEARNNETAKQQFFASTTELSYEQFLKKINQQNRNQDLVEMTEFKNGYFFQNLVFTDSTGNKNISLFCTYRNTNYIFTMIADTQQITHLAIEVVAPFLDSLELSGE